MRTSTLLPGRLLAQTQPVNTSRAVAGDDPEVHYWLGTAGSCPGRPSLYVPVFDNSASVTGGGGNDPLSRRYAETRLVLRRLARACTCGQSMAAVFHWDEGPTEVSPVRLDPRGLARVQTGLRDPRTGGTSDLGPVLRRAINTITPQARRGYRPHLIVASDFEITDLEPDAVFDRLHTLASKWNIVALVLGEHVNPRLEGGQIRILQVTSADPPGAAARALFGALTLDRPGAHPSKVRAKS